MFHQPDGVHQHIRREQRVFSGFDAAYLAMSRLTWTMNQKTTMTSSLKPDTNWSGRLGPRIGHLVSPLGGFNTNSCGGGTGRLGYCVVVGGIWKDAKSQFSARAELQHIRTCGCEFAPSNAIVQHFCSYLQVRPLSNAVLGNLVCLQADNVDRELETEVVPAPGTSVETGDSHGV